MRWPYPQVKSRNVRKVASTIVSEEGQHVQQRKRLGIGKPETRYCSEDRERKEIKRRKGMRLRRNAMTDTEMRVGGRVGIQKGN